MAARGRGGRRRPRGREPDGYVLGLTLVVGTVMLLSSLSMLTAALALRQGRAAEQERRRQEDGLHSAAHAVVDRLATTHRCLAEVSSPQWQPLPAGCGAGVAAEDLLEGSVAVAAASWSFRLLGWQAPPAGGGEGLLALEAQSGEGPWRRGRFRVRRDAAGAIEGLRREGP